MLKCFVYNVKKMYILVIRNCTRKSIFWLINETLQLYRHFSFETIQQWSVNFVNYIRNVMLFCVEMVTVCVLKGMGNVNSRL